MLNLAKRKRRDKISCLKLIEIDRDYYCQGIKKGKFPYD